MNKNRKTADNFDEIAKCQAIAKFRVDTIRSAQAAMEQIEQIADPDDRLDAYGVVARDAIGWLNREVENQGICDVERDELLTL